MPSDAGALLTDLYQFTMLQAYFDRGMQDIAVFEFFVRRLPEQRNFLVAAGLEQAVEYLTTLRFTPNDIACLAETGLFGVSFLDHLANFRFSGQVDAMREGTIFFANEPILRVIAPLPEAQFIETRLVNLMHLETLIASKAARCVLAAPGRQLIDFGMRRAHGSEAGLLAARAAFLAGFDGTATVVAHARFGIPLSGTMAHSFIQAHDSEREAFAHFLASHRGPAVLLIDTYDTEDGARRVVELAAASAGQRIHGVRLDSGDLLQLSRSVRRILDEGACEHVRILASGNLDEHALQYLIGADAPIDGFGIGTHLDVSSDCPYLDCVYKLQEYAGVARRKRSTGKATWPGRKQVYRRYSDAGVLDGDTLTIEGDPQPGAPLLKTVMRDGRLLHEPPTLDSLRMHARDQFVRLPPALRSLTQRASYPVDIAPALDRLAAEVDRRFP